MSLRHAQKICLWFASIKYPSCCLHNLIDLFHVTILSNGFLLLLWSVTKTWFNYFLCWQTFFLLKIDLTFLTFNNLFIFQSHCNHGQKKFTCLIKISDSVKFLFATSPPMFFKSIQKHQGICVSFTKGCFQFHKKSTALQIFFTIMRHCCTLLEIDMDT